jgi:orotidine-5'-phosphate decarboxylase
MDTKFAEAQDDLIVALDYPTLAEAEATAKELKPLITRFKVGLELCTAEGVMNVISRMEWIAPKAELMIDLKLSDIPNTVGAACRLLAKREAWGVTVMAAPNATDSLKAAVDNAGKMNIIGVTVLTSMSHEACQRVYGNTALGTTLALCEILVEAGVKYVVCSPQEVGEIMSKDFGLIPICPGVRMMDDALGDQKRVGTPYDTIRAQRCGGHLVVGRPITQPAAPLTRLEAAQRVLENMAPAYGQAA